MISNKLMPQTKEAELQNKAEENVETNPLVLLSTRPCNSTYNLTMVYNMWRFLCHAD